MRPFVNQSLYLCRIAGINVRVHWSWFLVAAYEMTQRGDGPYSSLSWNITEYLGLFLIILMHEFGHALATRQTGGRAEEIILWPLGGIAFVDAPPRAAAQLWCIAAGPLVNVGLLVVLPGLRGLLFDTGLADGLSPGAWAVWSRLILINEYLLIFNMLPIYPLDGGQIVRSLLWFGLGERRSLAVASVTGLLGAAALAVGGYWYSGSTWPLILAFFLGSRSWRAWQEVQRTRPLPPEEPVV